MVTIETAGSFVAPFAARERERHVVYRTRNSEYHCSGGVCVAVRDRRSSRFNELHPAIGRRLSGALRFTKDGAFVRFVPRGEPPEVGDNLYFSEGNIETEIQTTAVCDIVHFAREPAGQLAA